jgi:hypothetical protein
MSTVLVNCPHCGKELRLKDRSKLGKPGKCPSCAKSFRLEDAGGEEEVAMTLADEAPATGTAARWVPYEPAAKPVATPVANAAVGAFPQVRTQPAPQPTASSLSSLGTENDALARMRELRRRGAKRRNIAILLGAITALVIGGGVWFFKSRGAGDEVVAATNPGPAAGSGTVATAAVVPAGVQPNPVGVVPLSGGPVIPSVTEEGATGALFIPHHALAREQLGENEKLVEALLPQRGDPLVLKMIPSGMNVVIHLRPAQLWSDDPVWTEVRYSLTEDVTNWIAATLKQICRRDPQQIEECIIGIRLGSTGTQPEIATVVRFAEEAKLSDLIEEFRGASFSEDSQIRVNIASPYSYLIRDTRTVAIAPERDAFEFEETVIEQTANMSEGIYRFLDHTDNSRVFTVLFDVDDVKRHEKWFFSDRTLPVFRQVLNWFGDDVETVMWSVDVRDGNAVSDLFLRTRSVANPARLASDSLERLEFLPQDLVSATRKMQPSVQGFREIIGRFPAMLEAYRLATIPTVDDRHVRLTTVLPAKAAPNLAIATLLAWDESTRTDFSVSTPATTVAAADANSGLPETVEGRLQLMMDAEFNNPFQDAIAYIADEIKVPIEIDGNALKDAGFTKNMPQKFSLGRVAAVDALREIVTRNRPPVPEKRLCLVIDEAAKTALITTELFATNAGQTIYPLVKE